MTDAIGEAVKAPQTSSIAPLGLSELIGCARTSLVVGSRCRSKGADQLKFDIQVKLEKDGSVKQAEIADRQRYGYDVLYRAAAGQTKRAYWIVSLCLCRRKNTNLEKFIFGFDQNLCDVNNVRQ